MPEGALLIDTHVWLWLVEGHATLPPAVRQAINQAATRGVILISAITPWEIGMLEAKQRIQLGQPLAQWMDHGLALPGVSLAPLTPAIACSRLPGEFHGDPADHILVATARLENATLVTRDGLILKYGEAGFVRTLAA